MLLYSGRSKQTAERYEWSDSWALGAAHHPQHGASGPHSQNGKLVPLYTLTKYSYVYPQQKRASQLWGSPEGAQWNFWHFCIDGTLLWEHPYFASLSAMRSIMIERTCHPSKLSQSIPIHRYLKEVTVVRKECMKSAWMSPTTELKKVEPGPTAELHKGTLIPALAANRTGSSLLIATSLCLFTS